MKYEFFVASAFCLHPSSLTVAAMSYPSLIKTLPETLCQPSYLAALASLGIHVLLSAVLPVLPLGFKPVELQRPVGLIELTPTEQNRLPQVSRPQVTLPPNAPQPSVLPLMLPTASVLPPLPPLRSVLPPLPPPPGSSLLVPPSVTPVYNYPPFPTQASVLPPLPPPPGSSLLVPPSLTPVYNYPLRALPQPQMPVLPLPAPSRNNFTPPLNLNKLPNAAPILPPPSIPRPNSTLPHLPVKPALALSPTPATPPKQKNTNQPQKQPQNQETARANLGTNTTTTSPRPEKLPERGRQELLALQQRLRDSERNLTATSPRPEKLPERGRQELLALQQRLRDSERNLTATSPRPEKLPERGRQELLALQQRLRDPERKPAGSASAATAQTIAQVNDYKARYQTVHQPDSNVEPKPTIRLHLKTCEKQLDGDIAVIGVVVNPEGKILSGPDFIPKNTPANIQQAARDYIRRYRFPKSNKPTDQPFRLEFKYDPAKCSEATPVWPNTLLLLPNCTPALSAYSRW